MSTDLNKTIRNIIIGGLFIVPFLPFVISTSMFFPFITGKNFIFRIVVEILFALWLVLISLDKGYIPKLDRIFKSVLLFIGVITVADIFGVNFQRSFWSNYERMEGLISLLHLLAYFILLISVFTEKVWKYFFNTILVVGGSGLFAYASLQLLGKLNINQGGVRVDATFGNTIYFAVHMLYLAFLSALYFFRGKIGNNPKTWLYGAISVFSVFLLIQTATRGTALGLVFGIFVTAFLLSYKGDAIYKKTGLRMIGGIFLFFVVFLGVRNLDFVRKDPIFGRYAELTFSSITNQPRYMVWNMAWNGFKENPILGWGQENFNIVFNKYYDPKMYAQEPWFDRAHNVFFDWLIAGGILGLFAYLYIFFSVIKTVWNKDKTKRFSLVDRSIITGLLAGYFVHNIFVFDNLLSYIMFFSVIAYIYHEVHSEKEEVKPTPLFKEEFGTYVYISLVMVGLIFSLYFLNIKPIMASKNLIGALSSQNIEESLEYFKKAISYGALGTTESREQLTQRAMGLARNQDTNATLAKQNFFQTARDEMKKQIEDNPMDARYRVFQGALYSAYGFYDDALKQFEIARELSPNKQQILFEIVSGNINKKDIQKAIDTAKFAFELEPKYDEARKIFAVATIYGGLKDISKSLLTEAYGTDIIIDDRFINAYAATGQFGKVIEIWKKKIEMEPNISEYRVYLAASYLADKQRSKAIEELKKASEMNPAFKEQADYYIKEIRAGRDPK